MAKEEKIPEVIIKDQVKPVEITADKANPIPVVIDTKTADKITIGSKHKTKPPETTEEEDRSTLGQRNINLIWETTQSNIAKTTVYSNIAMKFIVITTLLVFAREINVEMAVIVMAAISAMDYTAGIIIGFYFSRTNHSATGGTGKKPKKASGEEQER